MAKGYIIARGGGFDETSEEIWAFDIYVKGLTGKEHPNMLIIPTPAFDEVNHGMLNTYCKLGCGVDTLLLTQDYMTPQIIERKLEWADIIEVPGGNVRFTRDTWIRSGALPHIRAAYERGAVLTGSSAGGLIWYKTAFDNCAPYDACVLTPGVGVIPYCACPHYSSEGVWSQFDEAVKESGLDGIGAENGAALCLGPDGYFVLKARADKNVWLFKADEGYKKSAAPFPTICLG